MVDRDPLKRARSSDRDATIELIEAAYVDGQLGAEDRDLRVGNALRAETLGELDLLTRDLQTPAPPAPPPVATYTPPPEAPPSLPPPAVHPPPAYRRPSPPARRFRPGLAIVAGAMVVAAVAANQVLSSVNPLDGTIPFVDSAPDGEELKLDEDGIRAFLMVYEERFGTSEALTAIFYPGYAIVDVPTADGRARHETWLYQDRQWRRTSAATANVVAIDSVRLARLDVAALAANLEVARTTLGVEAGRISHVIVRKYPSDVKPTVAIYATNDFNESGYLTTDFTGRELARYPFQPR